MNCAPRLEPADPFRTGSINPGVMFSRFKVAACSIRPQKWAKAANADKMEDFFRRAARAKPHLILATEGVLEGYVISDVIWHRERAAALLDIAEPLDGPYIARFRTLARTLKTCLAFGFAQRIGRRAFNSAIFIDHRGQVRGTYHKMSEGCGAHPTWNFWRPGRRLRAFDTPLGRCGIAICSDRWTPLLARTFALDGARLLLIPTYGSVNKAQNQTVLGRARENGIPIVQANAAGANLIVSRGEIAAYQRGIDKITTAFIDVPVTPSPAAARAAEREFLRFQQHMEKLHYGYTMKALKKHKPSRDIRKSFVPQPQFAALRDTRWGEVN